MPVPPVTAPLGLGAPFGALIAKRGQDSWIPTCNWWSGVSRRRRRLGRSGPTHTRRVYGICFRFTGSDTEAQDLTQDVFLRLFRSLGSFRAREGVFAVWLARMTRNLLIDHYRKSKLQRASDSMDERLPALEARGASAMRADAALAKREAGELIQQALARLSPELRETVILRDLEEMEYREIASVLSIPEGTVKSRLNRGRAELARLLRNRKVTA